MDLRVAILDVRKKAFFSGTDDRDDNGNCTISGVIGEMHKQKPAMVFRFNLPGNVKINNLQVEDIFCQEGQDFEVPPEWLAQVKREVYTPPSYGRGTGGRGMVGSRSGSTNVVSNPNSRNPAVSQGGLGLDEEDEALLRHFGYPFANEEEGSVLPFPHRPLAQGRKGQQNSNGSRTSSKKKSGLRLPKKRR